MIHALIALLLAFAPPKKAEPALVSVVTPPAAPVYTVVIKRSAPLAADDTFAWDVNPDDVVTYVDEDDPNSFTFQVPVPATEVEYSIRQISKPKGGKRTTLRTKVKIGAGPGPGPTPTDPLQAAVNAAYMTDAPSEATQRKAAATKYIAYYRGAGATAAVSKAVNTDQLWTEIQAVENANGVDLTALPGVRALLKAEMAKLFPNGASVNAALDANTRAATAALYARFANLLTEASK